MGDPARTAGMRPPEVVNFGKSLIVPSVQELSKQPISKIPTRYIRADQCPSDDAKSSVPVIDVQKLVNIGQSDELQKLHSACKQWGFFQIINHGVSASLLENLRTQVTEFFNLNMEGKKKLWQQPHNHEGFGQLFVVSEDQKLDWSDMFYITTLPISLRKTELWEKLPAKLREILEAYSTEMKNLAMILLGELAKALKMDDEELQELFNEGVQLMRMNYYPTCPEPDKAIGFTPHSDADAVTILYQLNDTEGLQIRKDGKWLPVKPLHDAFVVNLGDIMEIISNGEYWSVEHRAMVNSSKERLSVATFYSTTVDAELGPARSIVSPENPAIFRRMAVDDYFKNFFARKLNGKSYLDFMKLKAQESDAI